MLLLGGYIVCVCIYFYSFGHSSRLAGRGGLGDIKNAIGSNILSLSLISLSYYQFIFQGEKQDELYLNLVLEYVPETVYSISRQHQKSKMALPLLYVKLYLYQLSRALSHIHALGICHRDIKPQNLLVNPENQQLKLCDFGSAKALVKGEPNVSYICSRYYRAPELIFGSTDYSTAIDIWSQGKPTYYRFRYYHMFALSVYICVVL